MHTLFDTWDTSDNKTRQLNGGNYAYIHYQLEQSLKLGVVQQAERL